MNDRKESVELNLHLIEAAVEMRVIEIKGELDLLHQKFKSDLQLVKQDILEYAYLLFQIAMKKNKIKITFSRTNHNKSSSIISIDEINYFETRLVSLRHDISK